MDFLGLIKSRRSIRKFTAEEISDEVIDRVIEAGTWAPSGRNNQPWRFAIIRGEDLKSAISRLTHYSKIILSARALIAVFLDHSASYDRTKDCQAVGACIQNMLLAVHSMGLGAVWLGEILKNKDAVRELVGGTEDLELMAVVALGHPASGGEKVSRKDIGQTIFSRK